MYNTCVKGLFAFCLFLLIILGSFVSPQFVFAKQEDFLTSLDTTYVINQDGTTHATFSVDLTNNTSTYFPSSYSVSLDLEDVTNILASTSFEKLTPVNSKTSGKNTIIIPFAKKAIGKNAVTQFSISFDTKSIAKKLGGVWEINIPEIEKQNQLERFNVHVIVPKQFGKPSYIKPEIKSTENVSQQLDFTKEILKKSGISIAYGERALYSFSLMYHLKNNDVTKRELEIAIPPTTSYQEVFIEHFYPSPVNVRKDTDGNWLASYMLSPFEKKDIKVTGTIEVSHTPFKEESEETLKQYLIEEPNFWQVKDTEIVNLAQTLKTPESIYSFLVETLRYDFSPVEKGTSRKGAKKTLLNPNSSACLEFTDLFITLARASGIPAREVDGYAYTQNTKQRPLSLSRDVLHAWPEYYDRNTKQWIMVDPTWGNTTKGVDYFHTFDFDHVAFAIKGISSVYPMPAGAYKFEGEEDKKDVIVTFANDFPEKKNEIEVEVNAPKSWSSFFPLIVPVVLKNKSGFSLSQTQVVVSSDDLSPREQTISFADVPPFGELVKTASFQKTSFLTNKTVRFTIAVNGKITQRTVFLSPFSFKVLPVVVIVGGVFIAILSIVIPFITGKRRNLFIFRQK